jgi:hypothetical protein
MLVVPVSSWAAIAFVSQTDATAAENVASVTYSQVVSAGSDRALYECITYRQNGGTNKTVSSVVFNSNESYTHIRTDTQLSGTNIWFNTSLWRLVAPTVTTANVVTTFSGTVSRNIGVSGSLLTGVSQSSPGDSNAGSGGVGTTASAIITTVADNAAIIGCFLGRGNAGLTVGSGETVRTDRIIGNDIDGVLVSTLIPKTPAGAHTVDATQSSAEEWVVSAASITPSGGSDPAPAENGLVSLSWTNGTDPGNPSSGIASTSIRRCAGASCTPLNVLATITYPVAAYQDTTVSINTTYGYNAYHTDNVGLPSSSTATAYVTTSATPPTEAPQILSAVADATGADLGYGSTPPTEVEVTTFTTTQVVSDQKYPIASFPGGRFTQTWLDGLQGACFFAVGSTGVTNTDPLYYRCVNLTTIVGSLDESPPIISNCQPTTNLAAGTTSFDFSCQVNKPSLARFSTTDGTYASMSSQMTLNGLTLTGTQTGLTNGSTTIVYVRGAYCDTFDTDCSALHEVASSTAVTLTVNSGGDTTPPGNVANLACTAIGNAVECTHDSATDAVVYRVFLSTGACSTYTAAGDNVATSFTLNNLAFSTVHCIKVKALDVANNLSAAFSNTETETTSGQPSSGIVPDMLDFAVTVGGSASLITSWQAQGSASGGLLFANIERCQVAAGQQDCANFQVIVTNYAGNSLQASLTPDTRYCLRGKHSDGIVGVSVNYTASVCATTQDTGLDAPSPALPFSASRPVPSAPRPVPSVARPKRP